MNGVGADIIKVFGIAFFLKRRGLERGSDFVWTSNRCYRLFLHWIPLYRVNRKEEGK